MGRVDKVRQCIARLGKVREKGTLDNITGKRGGRKWAREEGNRGKVYNMYKEMYV